MVLFLSLIPIILDILAHIPFLHVDFPFGGEVGIQRLSMFLQISRLPITKPS